MFVLHNGLPVFVQVGLLAAWQLEQGGQAVQIGHFVEGAQQEIHHHQTHEQVDWGERQETQGSLVQQHNVPIYFCKRESTDETDFSQVWNETTNLFSALLSKLIKHIININEYNPDSRK